MPDSPTQTIPVDRRIQAYRLIRKIVVIVAAIVLAKFALIDTFPVKTDQMGQTLMAGDRLVVFRRALLAPLHLSPGIGAVVLIQPPGQTKSSMSALRVAGTGGDSVAVIEGVFRNFSHPKKQRPQWALKGEALPAEFSPRDWTTSFRVPRRGDVYSLDSLSTRDFFFLSSAVRQENPDKKHEVRVNLIVDGAEAHGYMVDGFGLYEGSLDTVPDSLQFDSFFWERLRDHIGRRMQGRTVWLTYTLMQNNAPVLGYRFKESCIFLLADDWQKGYDSRYFGPVSLKRVKGRAALVLWSLDPAKRGPSALRWKRIMRLVG